jgi:hypothetical protein
VDVDAVRFANRLSADAVFGVAVTPRNVTTFDWLVLHAPVNVAIRNTFCCGCGSVSTDVGRRTIEAG